MISRLGRTMLVSLSRRRSVEPSTGFYYFSHHYYHTSTVSPLSTIYDSLQAHGFSAQAEVNLNKKFWSNPCSLALASDSPLRIEEQEFSGLKRFLFKMMLFYSKQSKSIRRANVLYSRVVKQVESPPMYDVFQLERTFRTTFSLLVLHMWLCLRRLKEEGKEGAEFGQLFYEIFSHDLEVRVSKAGVNLLLIKWMKDLERIFYGNVVAYDAAMLPEAEDNELIHALWRNVFADEGSPVPNGAEVDPVKAMARYVRREAACLALTDREAVLSGNLIFTPVEQ